MATTVGVGNFTRLHNMESTVDQAADGNVFSTLGQINSAIFVEGAASTPYQAKNFGTTPTVGYAGTWNTGNNWDITGNGGHLYIWSRSLDPHDIESNNGIQIAASDSSDFSAYGAWTTGGRDSRKAVQEGFIRSVIDTSLAFDVSSSPPSKTSVDGVGGGGQMISGSGQNTFFIDSIDLGSQIDITGGTTGARGNSTELAAQTVAFEYGVFRDTGGVFFVLSGLDFGDTGTGTSYFEDEGEVWLFEDQNVANDLYTVTIAGNSTGTNSFVLGNKTGSDLDTTGTGGNTLIANQEAFNFVITDANMDTVLLAGCNFLNAGTEQGTFNITNANAEVVSCLFSLCSTITLDNDPLFANNTVAGSTPASTSAAVDLGTNKPAADTFGNNVIAGSTSHNLRIEGVSTTGDSWDLDNIVIGDATTAGILVDYPAQTGGNVVTINLLNGSSVAGATKADQIAVTGGISINDVILANAKTITVAGVTEGTPVKVIANETVGTVTAGDVIMEVFADSDGIATGSIDYESAFDPSGLDVLVSARNQGVAAAAIAEDGGVFTDETDEAHSNATADMTLLPATPVVSDAYNFGSAEQFNRIKLNISTALAGTGVTFAFEYWGTSGGAGWKTATGVVDDTSGLTLTGENIISFDAPSDMATTTINSQGPLYYFRIRLSALTTITTTPVGSRVTLDISRFLPYDVERVITDSGLADNASWQPDNISKFDPND